MTQQPITVAGRRLLVRLAAATHYVYRQPGRFGSGSVSRPAFDRLRDAGLVECGEYEALLGKPILVTDLGRQVLAATKGA